MSNRTSRTRLALLGCAVILCGCDAAQGASSRPPEADHGERLAQRHCASCHTLTSGAPSPLPDAPSFPRLRARYSTSAMETILARRMIEIHRRMPLLEMGPDELNAFLAYWETVAPAKDPVVPLKRRPSNKIETGRAIVVRDCGGCHATGVEGASALPPAPPFRTLGARYELDGLAEALAEGISVGHPPMPELSYPADKVEAIIAYLKSVQPAATRSDDGALHSRITP